MHRMTMPEQQVLHSTPIAKVFQSTMMAKRLPTEATIAPKTTTMQSTTNRLLKLQREEQIHWNMWQTIQMLAPSTKKCND